MVKRGKCFRSDLGLDLEVEEPAAGAEGREDFVGAEFIACLSDRAGIQLGK